jgi:glyoxylase-like metal-dependent hydrolase (beta-lactamase superfamily II)
MEGSPIMKVINQHLYGVLTLGSMLNMYVIVHHDVLTVVDTGMGTSSISALEKALHTNGWSVEQVQHILITHAHFDHIGGLAALQSRCNAHTWVHRRDANIVRGSQPLVYAQAAELGFSDRVMLRFASSNQGIAPARVDSEFQDGDTLDAIYPGLQVIHLPGHSYGHAGFWFPEDRTLIGGDVVMRFPWGYRHPIRAVSPDWQAVKQSIQRVCDLQPQVLCIGHGTIGTGDIAAQLRHLI